MAQATVADIWLRIKQRVDIEKAGSSGFVSDSEGIKLVQLGCAQLQNLVMDTYEMWVARYATFTTTYNQLTYPWSSIGMPDFYKLIAVGIVSNVSSPQDSWMPLQSFDFMDMNLPAGGFLQFTSGYFTDMRYMVLAQSLELRPVKSATQLGIYFVPRPPQFQSLLDELPVWIMPSWEEYMVAFGAWMVAIKERSGVAAHKEVWQMISKQIEQFAPNRDEFQPHFVIDGACANSRSPLWQANYGGYY